MYILFQIFREERIGEKSRKINVILLRGERSISFEKWQLEVEKTILCPFEFSRKGWHFRFGLTWKSTLLRSKAIRDCQLFSKGSLRSPGGTSRSTTSKSVSLPFLHLYIPFYPFVSVFPFLPFPTLKNHSGIDNGSKPVFPVHSIRIIWHSIDTKEEKKEKLEKRHARPGNERYLYIKDGGGMESERKKFNRTEKSLALLIARESLWKCGGERDRRRKWERLHNPQGEMKNYIQSLESLKTWWKKKVRMRGSAWNNERLDTFWQNPRQKSLRFFLIFWLQLFGRKGEKYFWLSSHLASEKIYWGRLFILSDRGT